MPRTPRDTPPGTVQHIISRLVAGEFRIRGPEERAQLSRRFAAALSRTDWLALAFTWMTNHEHLGLLSGTAPAWHLLKPFHSGFGNWLNQRDQRFGPVYADRPKSITVADSESVARLLAYIHNNPVRAGVATDPLHCEWSSHRFYVGVSTAPPWLDVERGLALSGFESTGSGRANFHDFVKSQAHLGRDPTLAGDDVGPVRNAMRRELGGPVEVAPVVQARAGSMVSVLARAGTRIEPPVPADPARLLHTVSLWTGFDVSEICGPRRDRCLVRARRLALVVWTGYLACPAAELAHVLGISPQAASKLIARDEAVVELLPLADRLAGELRQS